MLDIKEDNAFFSTIVLYLRDICNSIQDSIASLRNMVFTNNNGDITEQIFIWPNDLGKNPAPDFSTVNLQYFLKMVLKWDWINDAKITPKFNENIIDIIFTPDPLKNS